MNTYIKYTLGVVLIATMSVVVYNKVYIPKHTFDTILPTKGDLEVNIKGMGNVSALNIYNITSQTGGKITNIFKDDGDKVKKGELLVTIDSVDLPIQLKIALTNVTKLDYELQSLIEERNDISRQLELSKITLKRISNLATQKFSSQSELDKAKYSFESLSSRVKSLEAKINSLTQSVIMAKDSVDIINTKIDRLNIYSPVDGYVILKSAEREQTINPTSIILKIVDHKTLVVKAKFDERISKNIKVGQVSSIRMRSNTKQVYKGIVERISTMSDPVTLERTIDISFEETPYPFYINEQAEVSIDIETFKNVIKIPSKVITNNNGEMGIWINKNNKSYFLKINKLAQNNNEVAISNISLNTEIIIEDSQKKALKEGMGIYK